jgi:hypothetical protein
MSGLPKFPRHRRYWSLPSSGIFVFVGVGTAWVYQSPQPVPAPGCRKPHLIGAILRGARKANDKQRLGSSLDSLRFSVSRIDKAAREAGLFVSVGVLAWHMPF